MMKPIQILNNNYKEKKAIGQFNTSNLEITKAILNAAQKKKTAVIIGTSEGERSFLGINQIVALINSYKKELDIDIILNADHCKSFDSFKKAVDAGYDAVHIDGSVLSFSDNVGLTKKCIQYAKRKNKDILVEGELGLIKGSSEVHLEKLELKPENLTSPKEAKQFVEKTKLDCLAIAIGSAHGVYQEKPKLDLERLKEINKKVKIPLVLHGGSGISSEEITQAIENGVAKINVNTELRIAWKKALQKALNKDSIKPYRILSEVQKAVQKKVKEKITLFHC